MKPSTLIKLGIQHTQNAFFENIYLATDIDKTKPVAFYALINQKCNSKCQYCSFWRLEKYDEELSIQEWQNGLLSIKNFVGSYSISFSGGEPLLKKGFTELLTWCHANKIQAGITTNGMLLANEQMAKDIVRTKPFNISFSIDSNRSEIHDEIRGCKGGFAKAQQGLLNILKFKKKMGFQFPVIIKPTVTSKNFKYLPELVHWCKGIGVTAISMQPLFHWTEETYGELWIKEDGILAFKAIIQTLIEMKNTGLPIMNPTDNLELFIDNFQLKKAPQEVLPCRVGLRNFNIRTNGDVRMCADFPIIGNIKKQTAQEIWYNQLAQKERKKTVSCKKLCLMTCTSQKTLLDKFNIARKLFGSPYPAK